MLAFFRASNYHRTVDTLLTVCVSPGDKRKLHKAVLLTGDPEDMERLVRVSGREAVVVGIRSSLLTRSLRSPLEAELLAIE